MQDVRRVVEVETATDAGSMHQRLKTQAPQNLQLTIILCWREDA